MSRPRRRRGIRRIAALLPLYATLIALATFPLLLSLPSTLPGSLTDPLQHLWILRWYKTCLCEGRWPLLCPEIQHPVGAPLGNFSPLHWQALLYLPLSTLFRNDALCFNLIWLFGLLLTGMGTYILIDRFLRDPACAALGGMLAMLSGPMLLHASAHLELIHLGGVPLFLAAWVRFVDRPSWGRLAAAAGLYLFVALCAAYYVPLSAVPAALYVASRAIRAIGRRDGVWLRSRAAWLAGFVALVGPALALVFANQLWALAQGYALERSMYEFRKYGAPPWTYLVPTPRHLLGRLLPSDPYADFRGTLWERASYLGVVTLGLLLYAAGAWVRFPRASYWWACLALLVLLGWGAEGQIGPYRVPLPAAWLKAHGAAFRQVRVPARFNLLVAVVAALIASAGLRHLLGRFTGRRWRSAVVAGLALVALVDLAQVPFPIATIPPVPPAYARLLRRHPGATLLEVPQYPSDGAYLTAIAAYWQSQHRGRSSTGYSGQANIRFDNLVTRNAPFLARRLEDPRYLADPNSGPFCDIVSGVAFDDYVWLYATALGFDHIVLHRWSDPHYLPPPGLERARARLRPAEVEEDAAVIIYARDRLPPPRRPAILPMLGWRATWDGRPSRVAERRATLAIYNPDPERRLTLTLEARAFRNPRTVRLMSDAVELGRWVIEPDRFRTYTSPPLRLPAGLRELMLLSDADERPHLRSEAAWETDRAPYSLRVIRLRIEDSSNAYAPFVPWVPLVRDSGLGCPCQEIGRSGKVMPCAQSRPGFRGIPPRERERRREG
ncbi:MAG: hypothetical protein IRY99_01700 [Isosphaeraceae bacterium]|nr:hypothetical protein [Isosphaeraceae bacterium]